jgi:hypothetical protein
MALCCHFHLIMCSFAQRPSDFAPCRWGPPCILPAWQLTAPCVLLSTPYLQYSGYNEDHVQALNESIGLPGVTRHAPSNRNRRPLSSVSTRDVAMRPATSENKAGEIRTCRQAGKMGLVKLESRRSSKRGRGFLRVDILKGPALSEHVYNMRFHSTAIFRRMWVLLSTRPEVSVGPQRPLKLGTSSCGIPLCFRIAELQVPLCKSQATRNALQPSL